MSECEEESTKLLEDNYEEPTPMDRYLLSWKILRVASKDLWLIYLINFFHFSAFFTLVSILATYMTDVKDVTDSSIGVIFALIGGSGIFFSIFFGSFADRFGIKFTLILGTALESLKYLLLVLFDNLYLQIFFLVIPGVMGTTIANPAFQVGLKVFTSEEYQTLAISLFCSFTYLGSLLGGAILQLFLSYFEKDEESFRILFSYLLVISTISCVLSFFLTNNKKKVREDDVNEAVSGWGHTRGLLILKRVWRLFGIIWALVVIRTVFFHQGVILPLYMDRDLGDDTYYGLMIILNQVIIIISTPLLVSTIYYLTPYTIFIIVGCIAIISPISFFFGASYPAIVIYIFFSSIGESMLSFRVVDYVLSLSPAGKEAILFALATVPLVFSAIISGIIGGVLMDQFCPEDGDKECWKVWGIVALTAIPGTLLLFLLRSCLEDKVFESNPYVQCCKEAKED